MFLISKIYQKYIFVNSNTLATLRQAKVEPHIPVQVTRMLPWGEFTIWEFCFFNPTQNSIWTKMSPLTFLMVMICFPKVNNTIPDRFPMFLSCQNYFLTIWGHKNVKKRPQNHLNTPYFGVLRRILVTFSANPPIINNLGWFRFRSVAFDFS